MALRRIRAEIDHKQTCKKIDHVQYNAESRGTDLEDRRIA